MNTSTWKKQVHGRQQIVNPDEYEGVVFIGDIHGRIDIMEWAIKDSAHFKVFVGDYVDGNSSKECQIECLNFAMELAEREDSICLMGNHEITYLKNEYCSGQNMEVRRYINPQKTDIAGLFPIFTMIAYGEQKILVSHAGFSGKRFNKEDIVDIIDGKKELASKDIYDIGWSRGGWHDCGGILWCDCVEEFASIPGVTQVFGHTSYKKTSTGYIKYSRPRNIDGNWNIDCLSMGNNVVLLSKSEYKVHSFLEL